MAYTINLRIAKCFFNACIISNLRSLNSLKLMKKVSQVLLCLTKVQSHRSHMYLAENDVLDILFDKVNMFIVRTFVLNKIFHVAWMWC